MAECNGYCVGAQVLYSVKISPCRTSSTQDLRTKCNFAPDHHHPSPLVPRGVRGGGGPGGGGGAREHRILSEIIAGEKDSFVVLFLIARHLHKMNRTCG